MRFLAAVVFLLLAACSLRGGAQASPSGGGSPTPSKLASASGKLDAQVPVPAGFPADVPIYPGARLTAGAGFGPSGGESWGMEWETLDPISKVQPFYADKMAQGDWTISFTSTAADGFKATFKRKSTSQVSGRLDSNSVAGLTKILMSLVTSTG